jgi:5-keto 4-deoxyuronate isomerase
MHCVHGSNILITSTSKHEYHFNQCKAKREYTSNKHKSKERFNKEALKNKYIHKDRLNECSLIASLSDLDNDSDHTSGSLSND